MEVDEPHNAVAPLQGEVSSSTCPSGLDFFINVLNQFEGATLMDNDGNVAQIFGWHHDRFRKWYLDISSRCDYRHVRQYFLDYFTLRPTLHFK